MKFSSHLFRKYWKLLNFKCLAMQRDFQLPPFMREPPTKPAIYGDALLPSTKRKDLKMWIKKYYFVNHQKKPT